MYTKNIFHFFFLYCVTATSLKLNQKRERLWIQRFRSQSSNRKERKEMLRESCWNTEKNLAVVPVRSVRYLLLSSRFKRRMPSIAKNQLLPIRTNINWSLRNSHHRQPISSRWRCKFKHYFSHLVANFLITKIVVAIANKITIWHRLLLWLKPSKAGPTKWFISCMWPEFSDIWCIIRDTSKSYATLLWTDSCQIKY